MKNLFLLSLAAACVCACAQNASSEAVYEWEGVKLSYDSARYEIRELDEDYGVNFDLVEKEKPENWMHFAIHGDTVYLEASDAERSEMFMEEVDLWWREFCVSDGFFEAEWGQEGGLKNYSLNPDSPVGAGAWHPFMGKREHKPVWGAIAADGAGLYVTVMYGECDNAASRDAFMDIFRGIVYPEPEPREPVGEEEEDDDPGFEEIIDNGDTWETLSLGELIELGCDNMEYDIDILSEKPDELSFRLTKLDTEGDVTGLFRFWLAGAPLDTSDEAAWQGVLRKDLSADMAALEEDADFDMDGRFSAWEALDADFGQYVRYEGERFGSGEVEGLFAAKGYKKCRATMRAEAPDEDAMWGMLSLFGDVRFNVE